MGGFLSEPVSVSPITNFSIFSIPVDTPIDFWLKTDKTGNRLFLSVPVSDRNTTKKYTDRFPYRFWTKNEKLVMGDFLSEPVSVRPITNFSVFSIPIDSPIDFRH